MVIAVFLPIGVFFYLTMVTVSSQSVPGYDTYQRVLRSDREYKLSSKEKKELKAYLTWDDGQKRDWNRIYLFSVYLGYIIIVFYVCINAIKRERKLIKVYNIKK